MLTSIMLAKLIESATLKEMLFSSKKDTIFVCTSLDHDWFNWFFWGRYKKLVHHLLFPLFPVHALLFTMHCFTNSFLVTSECTMSVIVFFVTCNTWTYSSFLLGKDSPKICAAALELLHPLKLLSQNMHTAFLALPFPASLLFVTAKHCQRKYAAWLSSSCSRYALLMSSSLILWGKNWRKKYKPAAAWDSQIWTCTSWTWRQKF